MRSLWNLAKDRKLRTNISIGALLFVAMLFAGIGNSHKAFNSVEVSFTDSSHSGLAIVPASCPSNPGDADAPYGCSGSTPLCPNGSAAPNGNVSQCTCAQGNAAACAPNPICQAIFSRMGAIGPGCATCPNGALAPGNNASQCTCAQGNAAMCAHCPNGAVAPNNNPSQCSCAQGNTALCAHCPNGAVAPNNDPSQCTCAQGNTNACSRSSCPAGQHASGQACVCDSTNLPPNANGQCTGLNCPTGFQYDPGTRQCIAINQCTLPNTCSDITHVLNQCTGGVTNCTLNGPGWVCQNGACIKSPPPIASIITSAKLVQPGTVVTVSWTSQNTSDCAVSANNGDGPWSSISGSHASSPIQAQTIYTLVCHGYDGSTITKKATINIIPIETEK